MIFDNKNNEEEDKADFFENPGPEIEEKPEKPSYKPEDPDYWEEESEWEHLKPNTGLPLWLWIVVALACVGLVVGCWIRFFSPYIDDAVQYGYVEHIESRGTLFKTYEGTLIPYKELMDTTRIYNRDFVFSVDDKNTAVKLRQAQYDGRPVMVGYKQYHATLPWRGASKIVVTSVDSVDPAKILPPEFAPKR